MPKSATSTFLWLRLAALSGAIGLAGCSTADQPGQTKAANKAAAAAVAAAANAPVVPTVMNPDAGKGTASTSGSDTGTGTSGSSGSNSDGPIGVPDPASGSSSASGTASASGSGTDLAVSDVADDPNFKPTDFSDADALHYLVQKCAVCHKPGAGNDSAWPMGAPENFTMARFGSDPFGPAVYASIGNKFLGFTSSSPKPMPFGGTLTPEMKRDLAGILLWMKARFEVAVSEGEERLGGPLNLTGPKVATKYSCAKPPTKSQYMRRIFGDLFDRNPSASDEAKFIKDATDAKTLADSAFRTAVLNEIFKPKSLLNLDFRNKALPKFAAKVSGATTLSAGDDFSDDTVADLKKEFLQLLLKYVETKSFRDILLSQKILVTKNTAKLYGADCETQANASSDTWVECALSKERSNFFGSVGYLALWKSSFLRNNNNYTRVAHMYTVLSGEALQPKTTGPTGGAGEVNPALACMKSHDWRGRLADAANPNSALLKNGTLAIPSVGSYCQSCHIGRNLANGSIVFRKFGLNGEVIDKESIAAVSLAGPTPAIKPKYYDQVLEAAGVGRVFIDKDIAGMSRDVAPIKDHIDRLANLLDVSDEENKGCAVDTINGKPVQKDIITLGDLVSEVVGDGKILVQGLGRHIPRAFGSQSLTNQEILSALAKAYSEGDGKLYPLFAAYLKTESYACMRNDNDE